jgi:PAS domain S-box-containing protein
MSEQILFYQGILENMSDGVLTLNMSGSVIMFNEAASKILGIPREEVLNRPFAEVFFIGDEANDAFNEAILDAVYQSALGHNVDVPFVRPDGGTIRLSVTCSYLTAPSDEGKTERQGVIAVFSDMTEVTELQEAERSLHRELRDAYVRMEETNRGLSAALKKVRVIRIAGSALLALFLAGTGLFYWSRTSIPSLPGSSGPKVETSQPQEGQTVKVTARPVSASISLSGKIEPLELVNIAVPFQGKVKEKHFRFGQEVRKGDLLLLLDTSELEVKLRKAEGAYLKARERFIDLEGWEKGMEVARARRSLVRAQSNLQSAERKLAQTEFLLGRGIVAEDEHLTNKQQAHTSQLEVKSAEDELAATLKKGSPENFKIARMELENARVELEEVQNRISLKEVRAPVSGIVLRVEKPGSKTEEGKSETMALEPMTPVKEGDVLLAVGNLEGRSIHATVDEVDVRKISVGQTARCGGEGFPGTVLDGKISHISSQASKPSSGGSKDGIAYFDVVAAITEMTDEERQKVYVGMTANLEVITYENNGALLVPLEAVAVEGKKRFATLKDPSTGELEQVAVETGITTVGSVEIKSGLKEGDEVVLSLPATRP